MRTVSIAIAFGAAVAGCGGALARKLEPLEGYRQVAPDAPPFDEARAVCQKDAEFRTASDNTFTDWEQFEHCMQQRGWTRAPADAERLRRGERDSPDAHECLRRSSPPSASQSVGARSPAPVTDNRVFDEPSTASTRARAALNVMAASGELRGVRSRRAALDSTFASAVGASRR
jgi:hypothetical protein